jgi:hypothetical protein
MSQGNIATTPPGDTDRVTLSFNASRESVGIGLVSGGVGAAIGALVGRVTFGTVGAGIGALAGFAVVGSGMFLIND